MIKTIKELKTVRGQSAKIVKNENNKFVIELYSNGEWVKPCSGYDKEFGCIEDATDYFFSVKNTIHC